MTYAEVLDASTSHRTDIVTVNVDDGDDLIDVTTENEEGQTTVRLTIAETLTLISNLTAGVRAALTNRE